MIFITSYGEIFLLLFQCQFVFFFFFFLVLVHFTIKKNKKSAAGLFLCAIFILQDYMSSGFEL